MWIPSWDQYRSYRQISTIGLDQYRSYRQISTIGFLQLECPNPKQCNSPWTQNPFHILEKIVSNNLCLDTTFSNWPQFPWYLKFKKIWKPINHRQIFNCGPKRPRHPAKKHTRYWKLPRVPPAEVWPRPRKQCNNLFTQFLFLILSTGLPRCRLPPKIAARWRYRLPMGNLTAKQSVLCQL